MSNILQPLDRTCFGVDKHVSRQKLATSFAEEILPSKQEFFTVYMSNRNHAYNPEVIADSWKRAGIFPRNQLLALNNFRNQMNLPLLDEVPPTDAENQVTENAKKKKLPPSDQTRSKLDSTHSATPVFNNRRSKRIYMRNHPRECLRALKRAHDETEKLLAEIVLTQQNLIRATNQLDEMKRKQYTKRPRVTNNQNNPTGDMHEQGS